MSFALPVNARAGAGSALAGRDASFRAAVLTPPRLAPEVRLTASGGAEFRLSQQRGHIVLLTFGYTSCPDVCPIILAKLAQARAQLGPLAPQVQIVFVTVDPARDTPDLMAARLGAFDPTIVGLTGTPADLARARQAYGVVAQQVRPRPGSEVDRFDHSAPVYVVDRYGRLRLMFTSGTSVEDMTHDLHVLLDDG
ncbi:MAG TPA: SCO family protein [candidate division Zixibacteria bacterium]|nr:SCO family protein [candidate division Zixibacteria bacterium]